MKWHWLISKRTTLSQISTRQIITVRYFPNKGTTWFNINVPEGSFQIVHIDEYVRRIMKENGHAAAAGDGDVGGEIYPVISLYQSNQTTISSAPYPSAAE